MNDTLYALIALAFCGGIPTLLAILVYAIYRERRAPKAATTKLTRPTRKPTRKANPLLSSLATVCLLVVLYLIFFTDNWPLAILFALMGLAFSGAARK